MMLSIARILYVLVAALLAFYAGSTLLLLAIYWRHRHRKHIPPTIDKWPTVAVQLPVYNERHVVAGLLAAVANLDYPQNRLFIQILDDSTDETTALIAQQVVALRQRGLCVQHVRRDNRAGYKAGALAYGLAQIDSEYVLVLDADFRPPPDFLRRTIPYLVVDEALGMVQARWGHLNAFDNALTLGQTLALDGHFLVEQTARNRMGWLMNFSGSGGIWRASCIRAVGGWQATTLTEDLELSYRAQLAGWHFLFVPEVEIPAELPPQMAAYKQQQARWAQGSTQTLRQLFWPLWHAHLTLDQRIMATLHLCQYLPHPLMLSMLALTPPLMLVRGLDDLPLAPLGILGLGPPLLFVISQRALYPDWGNRIVAFPVLLLLSMGIAWNNTRAVIRGLRAGVFEFRRTPKFSADWSASSYALRRDVMVWGEVLWALYALVGVFIAQRYYPTLMPYLLLYAVAFLFVAGWTLRDTWLVTHAHQGAA
jgi:cellulose synthase/poly-beta-1,6-N-acetylglucosamine synthase-like glycosyltransferase